MTCCLQMHLNDNRIIADLTREVSALKARVASLEDSERRTKKWLRDRKEEAGVSDAVSFDHVWAEALAALKREREAK